MKPTAPCYAFGLFVLDRQRGVLLERGVPVTLTPRALELLATLVEHAGELLHKDHLIKEVWGGTIVEENNLARQISTLRKALRERPGQHDYIVTVPGVGYRFVAPVTVLLGPSAPREEEPPAELAAHTMALAGRRSSLAMFGVAAGLLVAMSFLLARFFLTGGDAPNAQRSLRQLTFGAGLQEDPAWSPDGESLAFVSDRSGNADIWIQRMYADEPTRLTTSAAREWQPDWSPDGASIVFRSEEGQGGLYVVAASGGTPRRISEFGSHPRWSPAGTAILFSDTTARTGIRRLYVVPPAGGTAREVATSEISPLTAADWNTSVDAAWHPDGRRVSIWGRTADGEWRFVTVAASGEAQPVFSAIPADAMSDLDERRIRLGAFVWAPSGRFLYFEGQSSDTRNIWRVRVDPTTLAWTGAPERLTTDVGEETDIAISPSGSRLAFTVRSRRTRVWALDFDPRVGRLTGESQPLTPESAARIDLDAARDGSRVAYRSVRGGRSEVRELRTADREERVLLISSEWNPTSPRWSSDGRRLAYMRPAQSPAGAASKNLVAVVLPDERREELLTLPGSVSLRPSDWSSDGTAILGDCRAAPGDHVVICSMEATERGAANWRVLMGDASRHLFGPRFSPDQRWISFVAVDVKGSTNSRIYIAPVDGGPWVPITDGRSFDDKPRWSPDGRTIYFVSDREGHLNLRGRRFDPRLGVAVDEPFPVTSFDGPARGLPSNIAQIEFSVSDRQLFLPITETEAAVWVLEGVDK